MQCTAPAVGRGELSGVYDEKSCRTLPVCFQMCVEQRHAQFLDAQIRPGQSLIATQ